MPGTVTLHRVFATNPERIYRAFLDPAAQVKWLPPYGFTATSHHADVRVGGTRRMSFTNFSTGSTHAFGGEYVELVPHSRIRYTDRFDDLPGEIEVMVELKEVRCGTELRITQSGIPDVIPAESCYLGWQESLEQLRHLVEPTIPDGA